jgi:regulator of protease activity HflC (stomatin/prohibitin superfamily)
MSTLLTIVRSEAFQGIGKRQHVRNIQKDLQADMSLDDSTPALAVSVPVASAPADSKGMDSVTMGFQNIVHDAEPKFQEMMASNFSASGIEIQSLRIEQIEFADKTLQKQVSEFAMTNTKLQSQQQTINAQRAIQVAEAERDASTLMIKKRAEADAKILGADTDNLLKIKTAKAEAENRLILADAEAQAKIKIGEAEIAIQEKQNKMPNAQLRIFTEAQTAIFANVQKVVYTDQQSMMLKPYLAMPDLAFGGLGDGRQ